MNRVKRRIANFFSFLIFYFFLLTAVDEYLEPVLIEINFSPSLACGTPLDLELKSNVIADTLSLACVQPYDEVKMKGRIRPKKKKSKNSKDPKKTKKGNIKKQNSFSGSPTNYAVDAQTLASLAPDERRAIAEFEAENRVSNGYQCIFPSADGFMYRQFFDEIRPLNELMSQYMVNRLAKEREEEELRQIEKRSLEESEAIDSGESIGSESVASSKGPISIDGKHSKNARFNKKRQGGRYNSNKHRSNALTQAALSHADKVQNRSVSSSTGLLGRLGEPVLNKARRKAKARQKNMLTRKTSVNSDDAFRYLF
jgi:hypothetical protein